jgi:hypothetical protein
MSYLSELRSGAITPAQFLKKSAAWLADLVGLTDAKIDEVVAAADKATDEAEERAKELFSALIAQSFPAVPGGLRDVVVEQAVQVAFKVIDAGLAGFGEELKKITPDA